MVFWFAYNVLFVVGYMLMFPKFRVRMCKRGGYRRGFGERFGVYDEENTRRLAERRRIWVHAVSVGEVFVALRLMEEMRKAAPQTAFVLTTTTSTGHSIASKMLTEPDDMLLYFPCDFSMVAKRTVRSIRPLALVLTECELWPNLIRHAAADGVPVILMNGRVSEASYRGYRLLRVFMKDVLQEISMLLVQTDDDARRLLALGARAESVRVMGTVKYDVAKHDEEGIALAREVIKSCGFGESDKIIVGGSTWPGEELVLMRAYAKLRSRFSGLRLVVAPRHVERRGEVEAEIKREGLTHVRRSEVDGGLLDPAPDLLLIDTTGELKNFYACASVIFVGKSLFSEGGQNIIEAAMFSKAVMVGPHMENFPDVIEEFHANEGIVQVQDVAEFDVRLAELLADDGLRNGYGERAAEVIESRKGVVRASVEAILARIQT